MSEASDYNELARIPGTLREPVAKARPSTKLERFMRVHAGRVMTAQRAAQDALVAIERMEFGKARTLLAYAAYEAQDVAQADDMRRDKWAVIAEIVAIMGDPIHSPIGGVMPHDLVVNEICIRLRVPKERALRLFDEWWREHRAEYEQRALAAGGDEAALEEGSRGALPSPSEPGA